MLATTAAHFTYIYALAANPVDIDVYATATAVLPKPSPFGTSSLYWDSHSVASGWETLMTDDPNGLHEALYSSSSSSFSALGERLQAMGEGLQRWWGRWWMAALDRTAASAGVVLGMGEVDQHASTTAIRGRGKVVMMLLSSHAGHTGGFLVGVMMGLLVPESRRTQ